MNKKTKVLFRWGDHNQYTLCALIALLDERLPAEKFDVGTAENPGEIARDLKTGGDAVTVLAYSFSTPRAAHAINEIRTLKASLGKKIVIICGGPHATARPESLLEAGADACFVGEAEESLPDFLMNLSETGKLPDEKIIAPLPLKDFDSYPPFAYKRNFLSPIELRRGCPAGCAFCQTPRIFRRVRERSVEYVERYARIIRQAGREHVFFTIPDALSYGSEGDDIKLDRLEELLRRARGTGIKVHLGSFPSEVSPRKLARHPEAAGILKKYVENTKVTIGGQSGSDRLLEAMNRPHTVRDITESVRILRELDFTPMVDILFGIPGETRADRLDTLRLMKALAREYAARFNVHYFLSLPGTPLEDKNPEPVEDDIKEETLKMMKDGVAEGDFFRTSGI